MMQNLRKVGNSLVNALTVFISITFILTFFEVAVRLISERTDLFYFENFVSRQIDLIENAYSNTYHPNLGYIPKADTKGTDNYWGKTVTILEHGVRSNGDNGKVHDSRGPVILAVGDSFTFGDTVSDRNTWPAHLDALVKENVINGGVFGYGVDQTVLRAEELANLFNVRIALISFIPDDIIRAQFSMRTGVLKPYFVINDGRLVRKNLPVPNVRPVKNRIGLLRSILGYSYLAQWTTNRLGLKAWWLAGGWESRKAHSQGLQVACLLTKRLRTLGLQAGARVVLIAQYEKEAVFNGPESSGGRDRARGLLNCAISNGLEVLDLYQPLLKTYQSDPDLYDSYYLHHMTAAGNRFVAEQIAHYLGRR